MKKTIRILSLALCLAMLVGVFAGAVFAEEATETILLEENFDEAFGPNIGDWSADVHMNAYSWVPGVPANTENQHVKLTHNNTEANTRVLLGYAFDATTGITYERGKIAAKDLTFDAKIEDSTFWIEFFIIWDLFKSDGSAEIASRRCVVEVKDGKLYNQLTGDEVGTIPTTIDISEWHTWTVRCSRQSGLSGTYDVQILIDGVNYATAAYTMATQGGTAAERFALHARTPGVVEIDNMKVDELYLDEAKGTVTTGSVTNLWKTGFGALGTELTFSGEEEAQFTAGKWAKNNAHENTSLTLVEDEADGDLGGYLKATWSGTNDRYANKKMKDIIPVDATVYLKFDLKLDGGSLAFQVGGAKNDNGAKGRQLYADFRPDGLYYTIPGETKKADFALPSVTEWTTYIIKIDYNAQKATVYANGTELGDILLNNLTYSTTGTNFTQLKIVKRGINSALTGSAYVDNIKLSYGVDLTQTTPQGPGNTADASIIGLAAMMLPVSGIGLGALCLKRKKEN